ncbi:germ cell nuclear acidic protein-like [Anomaloglossus baeobatrachus]
MSKNMRKRRFIIDPDTENSGSNDQLQVKKKCRTVSASDTEDDNGDENLHQSHLLIPRSQRSLDGGDVGSVPQQPYIESEPHAPQVSFVQEETARKQKCPINYCILRDLSSPTSKYVTSFHKNKEELKRRLYKFFNRTVFENQLPGDVDISWNKRLRVTAGRTGGFTMKNGERHAFIEISDKICDSADRLRDTLIHEMCHVACWIIDGNGIFAHHQLWEQYCGKVAQIHPDLPRITEFHNWEIHYPVMYECSGCQNRFGRWTDSLDTEKFGCYYCDSDMVLVT